jgi:serine/threonine protein kinase/sugar lactone lactonase YvrE
MPLQPGDKLGPYEILATVGAGGMGVVYRALDTRFNRPVAVKVLADDFADAAARRRFQREAETASSLNHPHIVTVYDAGEFEGRQYLVTEFVDGGTLKNWVKAEARTWRQVVDVLVGVADGLAAAHGAGILHRDIKPDNILVAKNGYAKLADFGLAKLEEAAPSEATQTITEQRTRMGVILGTIPYMSPEQAAGKAVDARSDIFSFGVLLYEVLAGARPFTGATDRELLAVIRNDAPAPLPRELPETLRMVVEKAIEKDPAERYQSAREMVVDLRRLLRQAVTERKPSHSRLIAWGALALVLAGASLGAIWFLRPAPQEQSASEPVPFTTYPGFESSPSFSPDGNQVAFVWTGEHDNQSNIYIKAIGSETPLRLTTGLDARPQWSPDGRFIAFERFFPGGRADILLIPPLGGAERTLVESVGPGGISWSPDGKWLAASGEFGRTGPKRIYLISVETGELRPVTDPPANGQGDIGPAFSPDGSALVFLRKADLNASDLYRISLGADLKSSGLPQKLPVGDLRPLDVAWINGRELIFASAPGGPASGSLYRVLSTGVGNPVRIDSFGAGTIQVAVSRDGRRLAYAVRSLNANIWRVDLSAKGDPATAPERFIASTQREVFPQYSPDGRRIAFYSNRSGSFQIWVCNADGSKAAAITSMKKAVTGTPRWSPDSRTISFDSNVTGIYQVYTVSAEGGKVRQVTDNSESHFAGNWSQDGRWIYFASGGDGRSTQIWKVPTQGGAPVQVTRNGGIVATESADGKTLYYTKNAGGFSLWKMPVEGGPEEQVADSIYRFNYALTEKGVYVTRNGRVDFVDFAAGQIRTVVKTPRPETGLAISPDGRYLLFSKVDAVGSVLMLVEKFR